MNEHDEIEQQVMDAAVDAADDAARRRTRSRTPGGDDGLVGAEIQVRRNDPTMHEVLGLLRRRLLDRGRVLGGETEAFGVLMIAMMTRMKARIAAGLPPFSDTALEAIRRSDTKRSGTAHDLRLVHGKPGRSA